jgi:hypothetical protein
MAMFRALSVANLNASKPKTALFPPKVIAAPAFRPTAVFWTPLDKDSSAEVPTAVLLDPVTFIMVALPTPTLVKLVGCQSQVLPTISFVPSQVRLLEAPKEPALLN